MENKQNTINEFIIYKQNVIDEFVTAMAEQGVVFTNEEIEVIFSHYAIKFRDVVEHIDKGETK